jgi:flagellar motor switch protein FliM
MSASDLLSQEEIDVLLDGIDAGDFAPAAAIEENVPQEDVKPYDFSRQVRVFPRGLPSVLERINDRFAAALHTSLCRLFQLVPTVTASAVRFQTFGDFVGQLAEPASLNIVNMAPLRGRGLIVMESRLVFAAVDHFFGGSGGFDHHAQGRAFTRTEMNVVRKILERIFADLKYTWEPVLPVDFDYLGSESNPDYAAIARQDDGMAVFTVNVALAGGGGDLTVLLPVAMLEPIRDLLAAAGGQAGDAEPDPQWREALRNEVIGAKVRVNSFLAEKTLPMKALLGLKTGDVIPIEIPETLFLRAEGVPVFIGKPCVSKGHCALRIIEKSSGADAAQAVRTATE